MPRYYLAGPMNGLPDHNFPAFRDAARDLRSRGYNVVSPAELDGNTTSGLTWEACLARDLRIVLDADGVIALRGWQKSRGATLEILVACLLGKSLRTYNPTTRRVVGLRLSQAEALRIALDNWTPSRTTLQEADELINGDRQKAYGHPLDNFTLIGNLWGALIQGSLERIGAAIVCEDGRVPATFSVSPETVALMLDQLKVAREVANPKRDNRVDGPGYWGCLDLIHQERAKRAEARLSDD